MEIKESKLYAIYCKNCGEPIDEGDEVFITDSGNSYDTSSCVRTTEPDFEEIEYQGPYNKLAVSYLNNHGKEESRIKK